MKPFKQKWRCSASKKNRLHSKVQRKLGSKIIYEAGTHSNPPIREPTIPTGPCCWTDVSCKDVQRTWHDKQNHFFQIWCGFFMTWEFTIKKILNAQLVLLFAAFGPKVWRFVPQCYKCWTDTLTTTHSQMLTFPRDWWAFRFQGGLKHAPQQCSRRCIAYGVKHINICIDIWIYAYSETI